MRKACFAQNVGATEKRRTHAGHGNADWVHGDCELLSDLSPCAGIVQRLVPTLRVGTQVRDALRLYHPETSF
jgi:hypothetical protein